MSVDTTDDEILRRYLLGGLTPEVRERVENRLFSDDRIFWEHLCLVEDELINDYVEADLDGEEAERFQRRFLCTAERRSKLEFARALHAYIEEQLSNGPRVWHPLRGGIFTPASMVAVLALLLVLPVVGWQFGVRGTRDEVTARLSSGLMRGGGEVARVPIPPSCKLVRLQLLRDDNQYDMYTATLHEATGAEIWSQTRLKAGFIDGDPAISLTLPAETLPAGDYYVRLRGVSTGRATAVLEKYDFRILRD